MWSHIKRRIGAGFLVVAGGFLGRKTLVWGWNKLLEAAAELFSEESPAVMIPTPFPWFDALGLALMVIGASFLMVSFRSGEKRSYQASEDIGISDEGYRQLRKMASFSMKNAQIYLTTAIQDIMMDLSERDNLTLVFRNMIFYLLGEKDASIMHWLNKLTEDKTYQPSLKEINENLIVYITHYETLQIHLIQVLSVSGSTKRTKQSLEQWLPADREMIRLLYESLSEVTPDHKVKGKVWSLGIADSRFASFLR